MLTVACILLAGVSLAGPSGQIPVRVVSVEAGKAAWITPALPPLIYVRVESGTVSPKDWLVCKQSLETRMVEERERTLRVLTCGDVKLLVTAVDMRSPP